MSGFARVILFEAQSKNKDIINKKIISVYEGFIENGHMSGFGRLIDRINVREGMWNNQKICNVSQRQKSLQQTQAIVGGKVSDDQSIKSLNNILKRKK